MVHVPGRVVMADRHMRRETPVRKWPLVSAGILVAMYFVVGAGIDLLAPHLLAYDTRTVSGEKIVLTKLGKVFYPAMLLTETVRSFVSQPSRLDNVTHQQ